MAKIKEIKYPKTDFIITLDNAFFFYTIVVKIMKVVETGILN